MHDTTDTETVAAVQAEAPAPEAPASAPPLTFTFTGSGKEYFRIWIVNLLLTLATCGIYSAWAKVRRLQYFDRNTSLAGACFDFSGDPRAVLKGRLMAVALLAMYHYAFGFSLTFGVVVASALVLGLPFLMRSALRFRLSNTSYRALRFGFDGSVRGAYLAYLPPVATVLLPGVVAAVNPTPLAIALSMLPYLAWPLMHGAGKRYQHSHLRYGDQRSAYRLSAWRFVLPYLAAGLLVFLAMALAGVLTVVSMDQIAAKGPGGETARAIITVLSTGVTMYVAYLLAGPYVLVKFGNMVLSNTAFPHLRISSRMRFYGMLKLQAANTILTLLTLGLYRPFAVVRLYQYRLASITLETDESFEQVVAGAEPRHAGAIGDGTADFLGVDISW